MIRRDVRCAFAYDVAGEVIDGPAEASESGTPA